MRKEYSEWTLNDSQNLNVFNRSPAGRKLIYRIEESIHNMALDTKRRTDFHDGMRVGKLLVLEQLKQLATLKEKEIEQNPYAIHGDVEPLRL